MPKHFSAARAGVVRGEAERAENLNSFLLYYANEVAKRCLRCGADRLCHLLHDSRAFNLNFYIFRVVVSLSFHCLLLHLPRHYASALVFNCRWRLRLKFTIIIIIALFCLHPINATCGHRISKLAQTGARMFSSTSLAAPLSIPLAFAFVIGIHAERARAAHSLCV